MEWKSGKLSRSYICSKEGTSNVQLWWTGTKKRTVVQTIENKSNNFFYHGHEFSLKKSSNEEVYVTSNGSIVANILTDGEEHLVEIAEGKEKYVENFSGSITPIIENGHLVNRSQFISQKNFDNDERQ